MNIYLLSHIVLHLFIGISALNKTIIKKPKNIIYANQQVHSHVVKQIPSLFIESLSEPVKFKCITRLISIIYFRKLIIFNAIIIELR